MAAMWRSFDVLQQSAGVRSGNKGRSWLLAVALLLAGCGPALLPTPDRSALAILPTATATLPTPRASLTLPPRPSDTPTLAPTATPTPTRTATVTPTASPSPTHTPTPTATPTVTPGSLHIALGFLDELLADLEANGYVLAEQQATGRAVNRVVANILQPAADDEDLVLGDKVPRLLIYHQLADRPPLLLFEDEGSDILIEFAGLGYRWSEPLGWRDINGDGLLELPVFAANGGFCWACNRIYIMQLVPGSGDELTVRELTGALPFLNLLTDPFIPKWLNDLDGDGTPEIELLDGRFEFAFGLDRVHSPGLYRVYDWQDGTYVDASWRFPGYFEYQIEQARAAVTATYGQPLVSQDEVGKSILLLLAYTARGQRDEGWTQFWELSDPVHWTGEASEGAVARLDAIREHLRGQYERGEPFLPWEPVPPTETPVPGLPETPLPEAEATTSPG